ncbi:hypothetical protein [Variovorax guangxiensis]|uniref:DUF4142 domain-containing protein n=1 Tax=Variovorax guangxiensis TaxID=1775474 RepID=A0A502DWW2_9BURK|nr:hypothetical protein [Variovorax guangxiensis]RZI67774.1 MAG: hypothetical protein EOP79_05045 [Variovorax sp.]TPG26260.1 hypothetical protein EAH83_00290 [Variovorax ginsengisoli]TPG29985.1 hypothetical protein EAH82_00290 [Variovorax guangxiensis]
MSKKLTVIALACALAAPCAFAQFSMPSIGGLTGGGSSGGNESGQQDQLVRAYVSANKEVLVAQSKIAEAVGLKESAAQLKSTADALSDGATKGNLSDADKIQSDSSKEISARLQDGNLKMDAQSQALYQSGMASLGLGVIKYIGLRPNVVAFSNTLKASPMLAMTKLNAGAYVVTNFPGNAKNVYDTLSYSTAYAKSHDIPVPTDATKALGAF